MEQTDKHREVIVRAARHYSEAHRADDENTQRSKEDIRFVYNLDEGQWDDNIRKDRDRRPTIVINKSRKFVAHVSNQERINRIKLKVRGVDSESDPRTAENVEGLVRNIEYQSQADEIYSDSGEKAAAGGFGYFRIIRKYIEDSFDQELVIAHISNQYSVKLDPHREKFDGSDGKFGFIRERLTEEDFEEKFPEAELVPFDRVGEEDRAHWFEKGLIYIAEYFEVETEEEELYLVKDPDKNIPVVMSEEEVSVGEIKALGLEILDQRTQEKNSVKQYLISGAEVLEESDWPGRYIPIIEVCGDMVSFEGRRINRSLITDAKDPANMYNYWVSSLTETVAMAPKAPFMVTPEMISGYETMWNDASDKNYFYLLYNVDGTRKPERVEPPAVQAAALTMLEIADQDIKDIIGWYESGLGDKSNERSGKAIKERKQSSASGTYHFQDNLRRAVLYCGRQLVDLIPYVYNTKRAERIVNRQGEFETIIFNDDDESAENNNDLSIGKYDIELGIGSWDLLRKQESTQHMIDLLQYTPDIGPFLGPLVAKRLEWDDSAELNQALSEYKEFKKAEFQGIQQKNQLNEGAE